MDDAAHARRPARRREPLGQAHVDALELGSAAVQDGDEVDDDVGVAQQPGEVGVVVDVGLGELDGRQQLQMAGAADAPRRDADPAAGAARALDQLFADAAADEAGRAENEEVGHFAFRVGAGSSAGDRDSRRARRPRQGRSLSGGGAFGSAGPIVLPRRERSTVPLPPSSAA